MTHLDQLLADRTRAAEACAEAEAGGAGFKAAFWDAHRTIAEMPPRPKASKAERLAAYDARTRAGHEWHPWKAALRDAERWLAAINREIEQLTKPRKKAKYHGYQNDTIT